MRSVNDTDNDDYGMVIISVVDPLMYMSSAFDLDGNFDDQNKKLEWLPWAARFGWLA
jgi:hypothetical protein